MSVIWKIANVRKRMRDCQAISANIFEKSFHQSQLFCTLLLRWFSSECFFLYIIVFASWIQSSKNTKCLRCDEFRRSCDAIGNQVIELEVLRMLFFICFIQEHQNQDQATDKAPQLKFVCLFTHKLSFDGRAKVSLACEKLIKHTATATLLTVSIAWSRHCLALLFSFSPQPLTLKMS